MAVDEELGLAYLPVETPSSDFYGGLRPGNNLFAESIVAIDYKTGRRKWHFQLVHHPIWNMDIAAAPMLVDLTVDGTAGQGGGGDGQAGDALSVQSRRPASRSFRSRSGRCRSPTCRARRRRRRSRFRPSRRPTIIRASRSTT